MDSLLNIAQAAERLAVSTATIRRLILAKDLRCVRIRRAIRISEAMIGEYLWRLENPGTAGSLSSCSEGSGSFAGSHKGKESKLLKPSKASSDLKSLMRLTSGDSRTRR
jgi:excisionase family DNA binding protein